MEIDKEKLLLSIKEALGDNADISGALKNGNKDQILNSLPQSTKENLNQLLGDTDRMKKLLNTKEAKDLIAKFLKDK